MKIVNFKSVKLFILVALIAIGIISCGCDDPISTGSGPKANARNTPTVSPQAIQRSDGGATYLRSDGWPIPPFGEAKREEFNISTTTTDGKSVKVHVTIIQTDDLSLYIDNPLHLIDIGLEKVRVNKVKEFRTPTGIFCYRFLVNDAYVNEGTNKLQTRGALYPYSYYDDAGDGVFESLVISEKDRNGSKGFQNEPHLPKWAILSR